MTGRRARSTSRTSGTIARYASADAVEEDRRGLVRRAVTHVVPALERLQGPREPVGLVGQQREEGLPLGHRVARTGVPDHAGPGLDRVLLAGATGAEPPRGQPDGHRVEAGQ